MSKTNFLIFYSPYYLMKRKIVETGIRRINKCSDSSFPPFTDSFILPLFNQPLFSNDHTNYLAYNFFIFRIQMISNRNINVFTSKSKFTPNLNFCSFGSASLNLDINSGLYMRFPHSPNHLFIGFIQTLLQLSW